MFGLMYSDEVTIRRASTRDARNKATYVEVLDAAGGPLKLKCRIERRHKRLFSTEGVELQVDATMMYKQSGLIDIQTEDLIVTADRETYKVLSISSAKQFFSSVAYARAELALTRTAVPEDAHG